MVALDCPVMQKKKKKLAISALLNKMAFRNVHKTIARAPSLESLAFHDHEEEEEQEQEDTRTFTYPTSCPYSLSSGPLFGSRTRRTSRPLTVSRRISRPSTISSTCAASSNSLISPSSSPPSLLEEQHLIHPLIHPSDHMKTLLSQLGSSIAASKAAFTIMRASAIPRAYAEDAYSRAENAMVEELQTLFHLQMRIHSLVQEHEFGQSSYEEMVMAGSKERQEEMLKSYEGIISRFHDEIRRKDAVTEALKETLAKSMLKGAKLERRVKALEGKLFS